MGPPSHALIKVPLSLLIKPLGCLLIERPLYCCLELIDFFPSLHVHSRFLNFGNGLEVVVERVSLVWHQCSVVGTVVKNVAFVLAGLLISIMEEHRWPKLSARIFGGGGEHISHKGDEFNMVLEPAVLKLMFEYDLGSFPIMSNLAPPFFPNTPLVHNNI